MMQANALLSETELVQGRFGENRADDCNAE